MCATVEMRRALGLENRWGSEYDAEGKKIIKTDSQGRELYPDSSANMHSIGASGTQQSGMKIGGPNTTPGSGGTSAGGGSLKGDQPLTDDAGGGGTSGGTGDINY
tara:strand:+ start:224 stop:538 length:315 start_codon:yes stop_codon:yes gene_type:complete